MNTAESHSTRSKHHTIRSVSVGTAWRVLRYPFIILSLSIIPRMMGDEIYGKYAFFLSVYAILDSLTDIGTTQIFGKFIPEYEHASQPQRSAHLLHGFLCYATALTCAIVLPLLCAPLLHSFGDFTFHWFAILAVLLIFAKIEGTAFGFIYGLNQIARNSSKEMLRSAFTFALVLLLYWRFGLTGAFWGLVLNEVFLTLIAVFWLRSYLFRPWTFVSFAEFKPYLMFGLSFYVPLLLFSMLQRSGNVLVQWLTHSSAQVAYFDIANQFLLLTATFLGLIVSSLLPSLSALQAAGRHADVNHYHRTAMTYCGVGAFLAVNALGLMGRDVLSFLLGSKYDPDQVFLNALAMIPAIYPGLLAYAGMNYSVLRKEPRVYTFAVMAGFGVMGLASVLLIPAWRSLGATGATVLGYTAMGLVFFLKYRAEFAETARDFRRVVLVGACFAPLYFFRMPLPISAAVYCCTSMLCIAILLALRVLRWSDLQQLVRAFRSG